MEKQFIIASVKSINPRSAWKKGVKEYALMILENIDVEELPDEPREAEKVLLNGADSWEQYSYCGCANIYDEDIAKTLCAPSELKKKRDGELPPNSNETWLDVQCRALYQAALLIKWTMCTSNAF